MVRLSSLLVLPLAVTTSVSATPLPAEDAKDVALLGERSIQKRSFLQSCLSFSLSGSTLHAQCKKANGQWQATSLNLNNCVRNDNGYLKWATNGGFSASCPNRGLRIDWWDDSAIGVLWLWADCVPMSQSGTRRSELSLNERIHNRNGVIGCTP